MVVGLRVHPFIITLGTMWVLRGIAFVASDAESILLPATLTNLAKASLGLTASLYPVPMLTMVAVTALGAVYLRQTVMGRHIFAVGGNAEASRFSGLSLWRIQSSVFVISGLTAGIAAFMGASFYGSASCVDATGYELYVIASAVVGGASLSGGKGSAVNAMLGALLIVLIRQSIRTLHFDQNYEWIIIGCAIIVAVVLDRASASFTARHLSQTATRQIPNPSSLIPNPGSRSRSRIPDPESLIPNPDLASRIVRTDVDTSSAPFRITCRLARRLALRPGFGPRLGLHTLWKYFAARLAIPFLVGLVRDLPLHEELRELATLRGALEWHSESLIPKVILLSPEEAEHAAVHRQGEIANAVSPGTEALRDRFDGQHGSATDATGMVRLKPDATCLARHGHGPAEAHRPWFD